MEPPHNVPLGSASATALPVVAAAPAQVAPAVAEEDFDGHPCDLPVSVLLLTTAREELLAVKKFLQPLQGRNKILRVQGKRDVYTVGRFGAYAAAIVQSAQGGVGVDGSAQIVSRALNEWTALKAVFAVGFGYGLRPTKDTFGDIMISERLACISHQKVTTSLTGEQVEILRGPTPNPGAHLAPLFRDIAIGNWSYPGKDGKPLKATLGLLLSEPVLVNSKEYAEKLQREFPDALGGEMEGDGLYASSFGSVEWIVVKAICDFAGLDGPKEKDAQPLAAAAAAASLVHHVLSRPAALRALDVPVDGASSQVNL